MGTTAVKPLTRVRAFGTAAGALATGLANIALMRERAARVQLQPGDVAPDFALAASDGRTYVLSEFAGRTTVVVAWFPKAFTGGCTTQCESIGVSGLALQRFRVACFGASVDTVATLQRFAASMKTGFPILSDPQKTTARAYGVLGASGFPARQTFFIGSDGRILAIDRHVNPATHGSDIISRLTQLHIPEQI